MAMLRLLGFLLLLSGSAWAQSPTEDVTEAEFLDWVTDHAIPLQRW